MCASVCSVLLAASAAAPAAAGAVETSPSAIAVKAFDALSGGDAQRAVLLFNEAIESRRLPPELLARALLNRALAHQKLGQRREAIGDYEAALRIDALDGRARAIALYNRGLCWRALGRQGEAIEDFTSALFLDPYFAQGYYSRGNILHASGQYLFALADYDKALKYNHPAPHRVHFAKALIFRALGRTEDAREALYAALKAKPDYAPARKRLAEMLRGGGVRFAEVAPAVKKAARPKAGKITTASLGGANLNLRKKPLPEPVAPPPAAAAAEEREGTPGAPASAPQPARTRPEAPERGIALAAAERAGGEKTARPPRRPVRTAMAAAEESAAEEAVVKKTAPEKAAVKKVAAEKASAEKSLAVRPANAPAPARAPHAEPPAGKERPAAARARIRWSGWAIQLSSQRSEEAAWGHWKKLKPKVLRVVRGARPVVMQAEIAGRGTFYRLRLVGYGENRKRARRLCGRLKRRGTSCLVTRAGS